MTITPCEMYWITRASAINTMFLILSGLFVVIAVAAIPASSEANLNNKDVRKVFVWSWTIVLSLLVFSILGAVFTPRTKDLAAIIAIPAIVNSDFAQEKVPEALNGIFDLAEAWMEELEPKKEAAQ